MPFHISARIYRFCHRYVYHKHKLYVHAVEDIIRGILKGGPQLADRAETADHIHHIVQCLKGEITILGFVVCLFLFSPTQ